MRFQKAQVLEIAKIGKDTLRTWKKCIAPLSEIDARGRRFTLAELMGICLLAKASQGLGIPISRFKQHAQALFESLESQIPPAGIPQVLCIIPDTMFFAPETALPAPDAVVYIKVASIFYDITLVVHSIAPPTPVQLKLPF